MKAVKVDRWESQIEIQVPKSAEILEAVVKVAQPSDPIEAIRTVLRNPLGMKPINEMVNKGTRVAVAFDDPWKPSPSYLAVPLILDELRQAGVKDDNIVLVSAGGCHPKPMRSVLIEHRNFAYGLPPGKGYRTLPEEVVNQFWPHRFIVHDASNPETLVKMGYSKFGDLVEHNRVLVDYDLVIYTGGIRASELGGYPGTGVVVGLGSARSISCHHSDSVLNHKESLHADPRRSLYRRHKEAVMERIEEYTGRQVFYIDGVSNGEKQWIHFSAGHFQEILDPIWKAADPENIYPTEQADVVIAGLPKWFRYDTTRNPLICTLCAQQILKLGLDKPVLREGGVIILIAVCDGSITTDLCPSFLEVLDLYGKVGDARKLEERYLEEFLLRGDYLKKYTYGLAFHPIHPLMLIGTATSYLYDYVGKLIIATAENPEAVRKIGATWAEDFSYAWQMAERIVGKNPRTLVLPTFFSKPAFKFAVK